MINYLVADSVDQKSPLIALMYQCVKVFLDAMYTAGFPGLFQNEGYPLVELIINCMTKQCKGSFQAHPIHSKRRSSTGNKTTNPSLMNEIMSVSSSILSKAQYTNSQNNAVSFVDEERIAGQ